MYLVVVIIVILVVLFIVFPPLPAFLGRSIRALASNIQQVYNDRLLPTIIIFLYIMLGWFLFSFLLLSIGMTFNVSWMIGLSFLSSIIWLYILFLLPGSVRMVLNKSFLPIGLRIFVSWLAVLGFIGLIYPKAITLSLFIGLGLLAFISVGLASRYDKVNSAVMIGITCLCLMVVWNFVAPDNFRSTSRILKAYSKEYAAGNDRSSIIKTGEAEATYGRLLKDVKVAYRVTRFNEDDGSIMKMEDLPISLSKDSVFLVINHRKEVSCFEGQTFIEIKLQKNNGSYLTGRKIWIDADLIEIGPRKSIDLSLNGSGTNKNVIQEKQPQFVDLSPSFYDAVGSYPLALKNGQESEWITVGPCHRYNFSSDFITLKYEDGTILDVWSATRLRDVAKFKVINRSNKGVDLLIKT